VRCHRSITSCPMASHLIASPQPEPRPYLKHITTTPTPQNHTIPRIPIPNAALPHLPSPSPVPPRRKTRSKDSRRALARLSHVNCQSGSRCAPPTAYLASSSHAKAIRAAVNPLLQLRTLSCKGTHGSIMDPGTGGVALGAWVHVQGAPRCHVTARLRQHECGQTGTCEYAGKLVDGTAM
jgi:hypothetical protein